MLAWNAATDNVGVAEYIVYKDNAQITTTTKTNTNISGLNANTQYVFMVKAKDAAGNLSAFAVASVKTSTTDIEMISDDQVSVFPNPVTNSALTVELPDMPSQEILMSLLDMNGIVVFQRSVISDRLIILELPINLNGMYILKIQSSDIVCSKRIFITE